MVDMRAVVVDGITWLADKNIQFGEVPSPSLDSLYPPSISILPSMTTNIMPQTLRPGVREMQVGGWVKTSRGGLAETRSAQRCHQEHFIPIKGPSSIKPPPICSSIVDHAKTSTLDPSVSSYSSLF